MLALSLPESDEFVTFTTTSLSPAFLLGLLALFCVVYQVLLSYWLHERLSWKRTARLCYWKVECVMAQIAGPCPKRRARYFRCMARCERRRRRHQEQLQPQQHEQQPEKEVQDSTGTCAFTPTFCPFSNAARFYKLHLPPPLPLCPKKQRSRALSMEVLQQQVEEPSDMCDPEEGLAALLARRSDESDAAMVSEDNTRFASYLTVSVGGNSDSESEEGEEDSECSNNGLLLSDCEAPTTGTATPCSTATATSIPRPPPLNVRPISTPLIDLARMQQWKVIMQDEGRIVTRREAKYRDVDGLYALHWACSGGPPVEVVQLLLQVYPSAIKKVDQEGSTPLHFATHYSASVAVIEVLLQAYPKAASKRDKYGRSPLFHAVEKSCCIRVWKLLIDADPSMILQPCLPSLPTPRSTTLIDPSNNSASTNSTTTTNSGALIPVHRTVAVRTPLFLAWINVMSNRKARTTCQGRYWEKALYLLEAAWHHHYHHHIQLVSTNGSAGVTEDQPPLFQFVMAALRLDVYLPEQVIPMAVQLHPEQLPEEEPTSGLVPLALAASLRHYSQHRGMALIQLLLRSYPDAVRIRDRLHNRTPLLHAVAAGKSWQWGIQELWLAYPEALDQMDASSSLSPALMAATATTQVMGSDESSNVVVPSTASSLLRECLDPFRFLTPKQHERLIQAGNPSSTSTNTPASSTKTDHINTVYELMRANPSAALPRLPEVSSKLVSPTSSFPKLPGMRRWSLTPTAA